MNIGVIVVGALIGVVIFKEKLSLFNKAGIVISYYCHCYYFLPDFLPTVCALMLFDDTYRTIEKPAEGIFRDRGSKFLAYAFPIKPKVK